MMFKIKDLMIKIVPEAGGGEKQQDCDACSAWGTCHVCSEWDTCDNTCEVTLCECTGCGTATWCCISGECSHPSCGSLSNCGDTQIGRGRRPAGNLSELKAQLRRRLAQVEEQEKRAQEQMRPKSVAEVEALETKLQAALDELKRIKSDLSK